MTIVISALAFLVLLSFLVLIHELGHFFAARKTGVVVEEFGFGLPPRAKTIFSQGGTRFSLNWIPFGGFVRLKGENAITESERTAKGSFSAAPIPSRILILTAGVLMNFLFAILLLTLGFAFWKWIPTYISLEDMRNAALRGEIVMEPGGVLIGALTPDGTANLAGVPAPSTLLSINDEPVYIPDDVVRLQKEATQVTYVVRTEAGSEQRVTVPVAEGKTGVELQFAPAISAERRPLLRSLGLSFREAWITTVQTVLGIKQLVVSLIGQARVPDGITGIVGIAVLTHGSVQDGFMPYLHLVAILSLSLAILNILPFPALDGGRLMFVLYELVNRRPAPRRFELITNAIGFVCLISLILVITWSDIVRFILS